MKLACEEPVALAPSRHNEGVRPGLSVDDWRLLNHWWLCGPRPVHPIITPFLKVQLCPGGINKVTKKLKFPKGLQVQYVGSELTKGLLGVVVATDEHGPIVRFEGWHGGWAYQDKGPENCWCCAPNELKITTPVQTKLPAKPSQVYKGNGKHTWEMVTPSGRVTQRLRVPGGWLYKPDGSAAVFVPMPEVVKHKV